MENTTKTPRKRLENTTKNQTPYINAHHKMAFFPKSKKELSAMKYTVVLVALTLAGCNGEWLTTSTPVGPDAPLTCRAGEIKEVRNTQDANVYQIRCVVDELVFPINEGTN